MSHTSQSTSKSGFDPTSVGIGIALGFIGVVFLIMAVETAFDMIGITLRLIASLYIAGSVATFWCARLWEDGLTRDEFMLLIIWPREIRKIMKAGLKQGFGALGVADDDSDTWIKNESVSQLVGALFTLVALAIAVPLFVNSVTAAIGSVIMLLVYLHIVGAAAYFWMAGFHKKPLSGGTFMETALWEIDLFKDLWAKAKQQNNPAV